MIYLGETVKCNYCGKPVPFMLAVTPDEGKTIGHQICVLAHEMGVVKDAAGGDDDED